MQHILKLSRYRELFNKEKNLNIHNKSLLSENRLEFSELLSYSCELQDFISYQNKEKYYSLISQYLDNLITPQFFQWKFLRLEKKDAETAEIFLSDIKQLETFPIDLVAIKFGFLVTKISELSDLAQEFGPGEDGISDENFLESP